MRLLKLYSYLLLISLVFGSKETEVVPNNTKDLITNEHLLLGNPSQATADPVKANNFLLQKPQYSLSYSRNRGIPNWVSWHVSPDWLGSAPRQDDFRADNSLPTSWYQVNASAYSGSGFDRGHNCPSADRTKTIEDNSAIFLITNMISQAPEHNRGTWVNLEAYTRTLVDAGQEVYVIMGNHGTGGTGSNGFQQIIDQGRVKIPEKIWKVLVVLPEGDNDLERIQSNSRVIAVLTFNNDAIRSDWGAYRTSIDVIEQETGYDLLSTLPSSLQASLEAKVDNGPTR